MVQTPPPQLSVVAGVTLMPGQPKVEVGKGDAPVAQPKNDSAMESVQEQPEEDDLEME